MTEHRPTNPSVLPAPIAAMVRDLGRSDVDAREAAFFALETCLFENGVPAPFAGDAVAALSELVAAPTCPDRHWVLALLQELARAVIVSPDHQGEITAIRSAKAALDENRPRFKQLLADDDDAVFANVAHLLCILGMTAQEVDLMLARVGRACEPAALASALLSASESCEAETIVNVLTPYLSFPSPEVRAASAIGLATRAAALSPIDSERILDELSAATQLQQLPSEFQWWDGHVGAMAAHALANTTLGDRRTRRDRIQAALRRRLDAGQSFGTNLLPGRWTEDPDDQIELTELAEQLFSVATWEFRSRELDEVLATEIGSEDQEILLQLESCGAMAALEQRRRPMIVQRGLWLPGVLSRFLGRSPAGPLDAAMGCDGVAEPAWKRFRRWDRGESIDLTLELARSFPSSMIVSLAEDIFSGAYRPSRGLTLVDSRGPGPLVVAIDPADGSARVAAARCVGAMIERARAAHEPSSQEACFGMLLIRQLDLSEWVGDDETYLLARIRLTPQVLEQFQAVDAGVLEL